MPDRIWVYVDGFNYYYGLYRGPGAVSPALKWINPVKLATEICASRGVGGSVEKVRYFSAPAMQGLDDPTQPQRQEVLFRALRGLPEVEIILGNHVQRDKNVVLYRPNGKLHRHSTTASTREEKGSDVNLAAYLVRDAALNEFDTALVISNDTDLANALTIAKVDFGKTVVLCSPHFRNGHPAIALQRAASRSFKIQTAILPNCLLPDPAPDHQGVMVTKPLEWI